MYIFTIVCGTIVHVHTVAFTIYMKTKELHYYNTVVYYRVSVNLNYFSANQEKNQLNFFLSCNKKDTSFALRSTLRTFTVFWAIGLCILDKSL